MSNVGEQCKNGPWQDIWTCPSCYHDHDEQVTACARCATPLRCTIEREPMAVCTIVDPSEAGEADHG